MEQLEGKLVQSFKVEGLGSLASDIVETGIDLVVEDEVLKSIPIVGSVVNISKAVGSVRDRLYAKKVIKFLAEVGQTTQEQRDEFVEKNCDDVKRFEETVLLILEQSDRFEKSTLIGKVFKACILGEIEYQDAIRLSEMVNRSFWDDLSCLIQGTESQWQKEKLSLAGFYDQDGGGMYGSLETSRTPLMLHTNYYTDAIKLIANEQYSELGSLTSPTEQG